VRDLTSSVAGALTWNGAAMATQTQLALKADDSAVTAGFNSVNAELAQKQDALTVTDGLVLSGATLSCPPIAGLVDGVSGLSLGTGTGASQRMACYESGSQYFYGTGLFEGAPAGLGVGLGLWGGTASSSPDQFGTGGVLPHMLITYNGAVGINNRAPTEALHVTGNILCSGTITGSSKSFQIDHPDPLKAEQGMKLRHWVTESDEVGGSLLYRRQVDAIQGNNILEMPEFFKHLASHVMCVASPVRHFGLCWADLDADAGKVVLGTSKAGLYTVLITARRKDHCALHTCPREVEFVPTPPSDADIPNFPS